MIRRVLTSTFLALCLALTSLAAVVAETRMAAAGGYCGTGSPEILLDHAGLPLLDGEGAAIAAPDCPVCHLAYTVAPSAPNAARTAHLVPGPLPAASPALIPLSHGSLQHARAPPRRA